MTVQRKGRFAVVTVVNSTHRTEEDAVEAAQRRTRSSRHGCYVAELKREITPSVEVTEVKTDYGDLLVEEDD